MYTGYWLDGEHIFGPDGYTSHWISGGHIYGPNGYTQCWVQGEHIYGPGGTPVAGSQTGLSMAQKRNCLGPGYSLIVAARDHTSMRFLKFLVVTIHDERATRLRLTREPNGAPELRLGHMGLY
jgi:hypothetical protein